MECALFLVTTCLVQCKSEDRAVLGSVKWIQEDRVSVIPCAWVVEPSPIPETGFPVEGRCYLRKKTSIFDTLVCFRLAYMYIASYS